MGGTRDSTDNDSEASTSALGAAVSGRKRASMTALDTSMGTATAAPQLSSNGEHKKHKAPKKSTYHVRKVAQRLFYEQLISV